MPKIKSLLSVFFLFLFAQVGALSPQILTINPPQSGNNARTDSSPAIVINFNYSAFPKTVSSIKFGTFTLTSGFSQSLGAITISSGQLPQTAPSTVQVQLVFSDATTTVANSPWDLYTYNGNWVAYIPGNDGNIAYNDGMTMNTIKGPKDAFMVAITPDGAYAYVINRDRSRAVSGFSIIDTAKQTLTAYTFLGDFGFVGEPICVAISPDGKTMLILNTSNFTEGNDIPEIETSQEVYSFDISNPTAPVLNHTTPYLVGLGAACVAYTPSSNSYAYVTLETHGTDAAPNAILEGLIAIIDTTSAPSVTNPTFYNENQADSNLSIPAWIAPAPVDVNGTATQHDLVLNRGKEEGDGTLISYTNPIKAPGPQASTSVGEPPFAVTTESELIPQVVASPDSKFAYVTNVEYGMVGTISIVTLSDNTQTEIVFSDVTHDGTTRKVDLEGIHGIAIAPDGQSGIAACRLMPIKAGSSLEFPERETNGVVSFFTSGSYDPVFFSLSNLKVNYSAITPDQSPVSRAAYTASGLSATFYGATFGGNTLSTSPVGSITEYLWDFGDATPTVTGPVVTHTYATPGTYNVTLTVTNEGTTSTGQTYFGRMLYNNGSPLAASSLSVTVTNSGCDSSLLPPSMATIKSKYNHCRYRNTLTIYAPKSGTVPDSYWIYTDAKRHSQPTKVANTGSPVTATVVSGCSDACYYIYSYGKNGLSCNYLKVCN